MSFLSNTISFVIYFISTTISVLLIKSAEKRKSRSFALLGIVLPSIVAAFRESGIDLNAYRDIYQYIHTGGIYPIEYGWQILNMIAPNFELLQFISAIVFFGVSYLAIRKFDVNYRWMSWLVILVMFTGFFYNGTRQAIAFAFALLGISYFYKKKFLGFVTCIAIGGFFHNSAWFVLVILIIYWFVMRRVNKFGLATLIMSVIALVSVPILENIIRKLGVYVGYIEGATFNFSISFLLYTLPPLLYYILKPSIIKEDKKLQFCLALYFLTIPLQCLGMRISYADRMALYFKPLLAIAVPLMIMRYDEFNKGKRVRTFFISWFIFYHIIMGLVLNENGMYPYMDFNFK